MASRQLRFGHYKRNQDTILDASLEDGSAADDQIAAENLDFACRVMTASERWERCSWFSVVHCASGLHCDCQT